MRVPATTVALALCWIARSIGFRRKASAAVLSNKLSSGSLAAMLRRWETFAPNSFCACSVRVTHVCAPAAKVPIVQRTLPTLPLQFAPTALAKIMPFGTTSVSTNPVAADGPPLVMTTATSAKSPLYTSVSANSCEMLSATCAVVVVATLAPLLITLTVSICLEPTVAVLTKLPPRYNGFTRTTAVKVWLACGASVLIVQIRMFVAALQAEGVVISATLIGSVSVKRTWAALPTVFRLRTCNT